MLDIKYEFGVRDGTLDLDPALLVGDVKAFKQNAAVIALKTGVFVTLDANGYVRLAVDGDLFAGPLVNDAAGEEYENIPALASGKVTALMGGGVFDTSAVIEDDIVSGMPLFIGAGGELTRIAGAGAPVGISRSANSPADKTITVQTSQ